MEKGMHTTLRVSVTGADTTRLSSIEFIFKQKPKNDADMLKYVVWENGVEKEDVYILNDDLTTFYIPFTPEDTYAFKADAPFYIDARIHYTDSLDNPPVNLASINMTSGLFGEGDDIA